MTFALENSFKIENGIRSFVAEDHNQLFEIFRNSLLNALISKCNDYQLRFYFEGKQIDVLDIQFGFFGKTEQINIPSFKIDLGENLSSDRDPFIWIDFSKFIIVQGMECLVKFSFSGGKSRAAKMIDQNLIIAFLGVADKFFNAETEKAQGGNFLSSALSNLLLT